MDLGKGKEAEVTDDGNVGCWPDEVSNCYVAEELDILPDKEIQLAAKIAAAQFAPEPSELKKGHRVSVSLDACIASKTAKAADQEDISCLWFTRRNWYHHCLQQPSIELQSLPDGLTVKPSTYHMLTRCTDWKAVPSTYLLFIDGSAGSKGAAWSVVVIATDGWTQTLEGCAFGRVHTNQQHPAWLGATHEDNIAAEFTALLYALNWVFKSKAAANFVILPDLMLSKLMAEQSTVCRARPVLARLVRVYADWVEQKCAYVHVKAHDQFAWNELADSLANYAIAHSNEDQYNHVSDPNELARSHDDLKWVWMQDSTDALATCFPPLVDEQAAVFPPSVRKVTVPACKQDPVVSHCSLAFNVVTANVLAMDPRTECDTHGRANASRTVRLDAQWNESKVAIVGLQEARAEPGRFMSENYHIFAAGADFSHTAALGCEIWLHKTMPIAHDAKRIALTFSKANLVIHHADPRRLFLQAEFADWQVCKIALHAPCRKPHNEDEVAQWWEDTQDLTHKFAGRQMTVCMVDANAPLATCETEHVGMEGAEDMNSAGLKFEQYIHSSNLFAPTTMPWCHKGQSTTWSHPRGAQLRRDYVLVSEQIMPMVVGSQVLTDHDTTFAHEDHLPVLLRCTGFSLSQGHGSKNQVGL